jgi:hypothetical protein
MSDQNCDYLTMTGVCGQHQGRLSMTVAGVDVCTLLKQIADVLNITAINRVFPSGIHRKTPRTPLEAVSDGSYDANEPVWHNRCRPLDSKAQ